MGRFGSSCEKRRTRPFDYALTSDSEQGYDQESVPITED